MSGHNKWSKIKHKKAASDAKKSKEFSKLVRLIKAEARMCGGDVTSPGLKAAIDKARAANMPKDNIERAVSSASTDSANTLEHVTYEAYGPGGTAIVIEALTDNRNRTSAEIKHIFSKRELVLAAPGAATWAFTPTPAGMEPNQTMTLTDNDREALQNLLDELDDHDDIQSVFTNAR